MKVGTEIVFALFLALAYLATPVMLVWGWGRWVQRSKLKTIPSILSLVGFGFATISALLGLATLAYAQVHPFAFYDPTLLKLIRWGSLLSAVGLLFGLGGVYREGSLRWHAPVCSFGTLAFWILAAEGE